MQAPTPGIVSSSLAPLSRGATRDIRLSRSSMMASTSSNSLTSTFVLYPRRRDELNVVGIRYRDVAAPLDEGVVDWVYEANGLYANVLFAGKGGDEAREPLRADPLLQEQLALGLVDGNLGFSLMHINSNVQYLLIHAILFCIFTIKAHHGIQKAVHRFPSWLYRRRRPLIYRPPTPQIHFAGT